MPSSTSSARRIGADATRGRLCAIAVVLVVGASLLLTDVTMAGPLSRLDIEVAGWLHEWFARRPWATHAASAVSYVGSSAVGVPVILGVTAWCVRIGAHRMALFAVLTPALGKVLERTLKVIVGRDRPTWSDPLATAPGYSFPSGHAMGATLVIGVLAVVLVPQLPTRWRRPLVALGAGWALLVAFTRLALGVHYLSDVVAGLALGGAWLAVMAALMVVPWRDAPLNGRRGRRPTGDGYGGSPVPGRVLGLAAGASGRASRPVRSTRTRSPRRCTSRTAASTR